MAADPALQADIHRVVAPLVEQLDLPSTAIVYVGGSLVRGWGNPSSDLDAYVVGGVPGRADESVECERGRRVDLHYLSDDDLAGLLARVAWSRTSVDAAIVGLLSQAEWLVLERALYGQVITGQEPLSRLREAIRASAVWWLSISESFAMADSFSEDCLGMLEAGDHHSAVITARLSVVHAIDGFLASRGVLCKVPKWRASALKEVADDVFFEEKYWRFETMRGLASVNSQSWCKEAVSVSRYLTGVVEITARPSADG